MQDPIIMSSPVICTPKQGNAHFKTSVDEFSITWTLDNFLEWANSKKPGYTFTSPIFTFELGSPNETYKFALEVLPKGTKDSDDPEHVALYLSNKKIGSIATKAFFKLLTKDKKKFYAKMNSQNGTTCAI